ncbi:hypothetical protein ACFLY1_00480 [Patescibacteria group bacterium]
MSISMQTLEIAFVLMRKCGEKLGNPYSLKAMSDEEIRELYGETELPDELFDNFIKNYRIAMQT